MNNKCVGCGEEIPISLKTKYICYSCLANPKKKLNTILNQVKNK